MARNKTTKKQKSKGSKRTPAIDDPLDHRHVAVARANQDVHDSSNSGGSTSPVKNSTSTPNDLDNSFPDGLSGIGTSGGPVDNGSSGAPCNVPSPGSNDVPDTVESHSGLSQTCWRERFPLCSHVLSFNRSPHNLRETPEIYDLAQLGILQDTLPDSMSTSALQNLARCFTSTVSGFPGLYSLPEILARTISAAILVGGITVLTFAYTRSLPQLSYRSFLLAGIIARYTLLR